MNRKDCGQRTAHEEHWWDEKVVPAPGSLTGITIIRHHWCAGVTLGLRDPAHPSYLVVTATETIPAGAQVRVDTTTGTASLRYQEDTAP